MSALEIYKAMADESRLRLIRILSQGLFNVQELTSILGVSQSTISHHLKILQSANIATSKKEGTWAFYTLTPEDDAQVAAPITRNFLELATAQSNGLTSIFTRDNEALKNILDKRRTQARKYFDNVASKWHAIRNEQLQESYLDTLLHLITPDETLLELGCGAGALLEKALPRPGKTIGVDYSQAMLEQAKAVLGQRADNVDLRLGYLEHLPLADESVDTAVAYMVLHHIPKPQDALKDAHRVLAKGGKLVIIDLMSHGNEYMRERYADLWLGFEPKEMQRWAEESGYSNVKTEVLGKEQEVFLLTCKK